MNHVRASPPLDALKGRGLFYDTCLNVHGKQSPVWAIYSHLQAVLAIKGNARTHLYHILLAIYWMLELLAIAELTIICYTWFFFANHFLFQIVLLLG